jgi:hypothetical protein
MAATHFFRLAWPFIRPAAAKQQGPRLLFDTESDGLLDTATKLHCIAIVDIDSERVEIFGPDKIAEGLARLSEARYLAGHNIGAFDLPLLQMLRAWSPPDGCTIVDTLITSRLVLPHILDLDQQSRRIGDPPLGSLMGAHSLEAWGIRFGMPKTGTDITDWSVWTPEIEQRCINDVALNKRLWEFLQPDGQPGEALVLEHRVATICDEIAAAGMPFDVTAGEELCRRFTKRRTALEGELRTQFPKVENWNSRQQLGKLLTSRGWVPEKLTAKTKQPQIDDEALERLPQQFPEFEGLAEHQILGRRLGQITTGNKAWLKLVRADGRIHGRILHIGTPHSRAAHLDPNLAQVPNPKKGKPFATECRRLFETPDDWVFVNCDQAGLQDRGFSHYLAEAFLAGLDPHWGAVRALGLVPPGTARDKANKLHNTLREGASRGATLSCSAWGANAPASSCAIRSRH